MLDAPKGYIRATAKNLANRQFNDVVNKRMVKFSERTIFTYSFELQKVWL